MNYVDCIGRSYPTIEVECMDDPTVYANVVHIGGPAIPPMEELQAKQLESDRDDMWDKIQEERYRREQFGGTNVEGIWFHSDDTSKIKQNSMTVAAGLGLLEPLSIKWKRMDKQFVEMTNDLAIMIFMKAMATVEAIFQHAEYHKAQMLLSADPLSYDYSGGWPEMFSDLHPDIPA